MEPKNVFLILVLFYPMLLVAQETKKVTDKVDRNEKYEYYVLTSDGTTKHGPYKKIYNKKLDESGFYKNGKKDSVWIEYAYNGNIRLICSYKNDKKNGTYKSYNYKGSLVEKGSYVDDVKTGEWEFYTDGGEIKYKYNYTKNELVYFNEKQYNLEYNTIKDGDTLKEFLESPCIYIDGEGALYEQIGRSFRYPEEAKNKNIQGKVYITFTVDTTGEISRVKVLRGLGYGLDEEAIRAIESLPGKWAPAVKNGEKIEMQFSIPIICKLS